MEYHIINLDTGEDWYADGNDPLDEDYPNLLVSEFACKDGSTVVPYHPWVCAVFQGLRNIYGPIVPSSGYRTFDHNGAVGGSLNPPSQHLYGRAIDLPLPEGVDIEVFYKTAIEIGGVDQGYIIYDTFIHCDCRGYYYRLDKR